MFISGRKIKKMNNLYIYNMNFLSMNKYEFFTYR